jgi:hypothetical protein
LLVRDPHLFPWPPESTLPHFASFMFISLPRVRVCMLHMTCVAAEFLLKLKIVKFSHFYFIMLLKPNFFSRYIYLPLSPQEEARSSSKTKPDTMDWYTAIILYGPPWRFRNIFYVVLPVEYKALPGPFSTT